MISRLKNLRFWLCLVALSVGCPVIATPVSTLARESYTAYAARIVATVPERVEIRADLEDNLLQSANTFRASKRIKGLAPAGADLVLAARAHAMDMLRNGFVGHRASTGHEFESRMRAFRPGELVLPFMGENAARERSSGPADGAKARKLFAQWVKSGPHRKTLSDRSFVMVATGVVQKGDAIYAVQIFSGPEVHTNFGRTAPEEPGGLY